MPSDGWAVAWVRSTREIARRRASDVGAHRIHLFMAAPAGVALMLGHHWNLMPPVTVYEQVPPTYVPTFTWPG